MENCRTITETVYGHRLTAELGRDAVECRLTVVSDKCYDELTPDRLREALFRMGITYGIIPDNLGKICSDAKNRVPVIDVLVARGREVVHGKDAELKIDPGSLSELHRGKSLGNDGGKSDTEEAGPVNYRDIRPYFTVEEDSVFAHLEPARPGRDGKSVTGEVITARSGKPMTIQSGPGVRESSDGKSFEATIGGLVVWEKPNLSVEELLTIPGDVDFDIGHIDFGGYVHISGDVFEGFTVKGRRGIFIDGNAQTCCLESAGDIKVGGVIGHHLNTTVRCGGNFEACYVLESDIECEGNIHVMREAMRSKLKAGGRITVDRLISGSECIAMTGIEAGRVGTDAGTQAKLVSGVYYRDYERTTFLRDKLRKTIEAINKQVKDVEPLLQKENQTVFPEDVEKMKRSLGKLKKLNSRRKDLERLLEEFTGSSSARAPNPKINVRQFLAQGTLICLGSTSKQVEKTIERPVSIIAHRAKELVFLKMTDLRVTAARLGQRLAARERAER